MSKLKLITTENFGELQCNFYRNMNDDILLTREQIGTALEYANPSTAIKNLHRKHKDRLDMLSVRIKLGGLQNEPTSKSDEQERVYYTERGIMELCRWSRQPLANQFMDWVWDIVERYRKNLIQENHMNNEMIPNMTGLIATLESEILGIKNKLNQITKVITDKVDTGFGAMKNVKLTYSECLSDSNSNETYKKRYERIHSLISEIVICGNYSTETKVFSKIYKLMKEKCGIDVNKCRENYIFQNQDKENVSVFAAIINSPIVYDVFLSIANEMLITLKTYGSTEDYIIATNFKEAVKQTNILARDKYNSNKLITYKGIYKCMEEVFHVDWSSFIKNKKEAIRKNAYLQEIFIKSVNYLQYKNIG